MAKTYIVKFLWFTFAFQGSLEITSFLWLHLKMIKKIILFGRLFLSLIESLALFILPLTLSLSLRVDLLFLISFYSSSRLPICLWSEKRATFWITSLFKRSQRGQGGRSVISNVLNCKSAPHLQYMNCRSTEMKNAGWEIHPFIAGMKSSPRDEKEV